MEGKRLTMYAIAHNLVRLLMQQAVRAAGGQGVGKHSMRLSFNGALDATLRFAAEMAQGTCEAWRSLRQKLFHTIATDSQPKRSKRFEPKVVKRRPKPFPLMTLSCAVLNQRILENQATLQASI